MDAQRVDGSTGAFTQQVPLDLPLGRSGLQPVLSLDYNSQRTEDGIVGYGWTISIPYIERLNKTGTDNLYGTTPYFTSSIVGELAPEATIESTATSSPTVMDTLDLTTLGCNFCSSDSFSYTVPSGGQNKLLVVLLAQGTTVTPFASLNGDSLATFKRFSINENGSYFYYLHCRMPPRPTRLMSSPREAIQSQSV